jgi:hypothetical protein
MVNARKTTKLYPKLQPVTTRFPVFSVASSSDASLAEPILRTFGRLLKIRGVFGKCLVPWRLGH